MDRKLQNVIQLYKAVVLNYSGDSAVYKMMSVMALLICLSRVR